MQTGARRSLSLVAVMLLFILSALPPSGAGADDHGRPPRSLRIEGYAERFKHPKLDSQLMELIEQADTLSANALDENSENSASLVAVTVRVGGDPTLVADAMAARGALIANTGEQTVEAYAPAGELIGIADLPGVLTVRELEPPIPLAKTSQGVAIHGVPDWTASGFTGAGVKVGVIDIGFEGFSALIGSELPVPVAHCYQVVGTATANVSDCERYGVHGTAVTETVVDVAPDAAIYISNPLTRVDLHTTVAWMASQGVTIINHSVGWGYEGPGDGTSPRTDGTLAAVNSAVAAGMTWVNAAGNEALSSWSGAYSDVDGDKTLEFAPAIEANGVSVHAGRELILYLRWDDSWTNAGIDLDLFLVNGNGDVLRNSQMEQSGAAGHEPYERIRYVPTSSGVVYATIVHYSGAAPAWIQLQAFTGEPLQYGSPSNSITNPAESGNPGLLAVGATPWTTPHVIAPYSSQGPTRDGRIKPDVVGIDSADTASYGPSGFHGTSQASPHVAGLAALVRQRYPAFGPTEIANYLKLNANGAANPNNVWGYGLAQLPAIDGAGNPLPSVGGVTPSSAAPGVGAIVVTVLGAGFVPGSIVRWNDSDRPTAFISATELRAELSAADVAVGGSAVVTVFSPEPGGGISNAVTFTVGVSFQPAPDYPAFQDVWNRTDLPVMLLLVGRTWIWGDKPIAGPFFEAYSESPGQQRAVKYADKSRMEVRFPDGDPTADWYVTNGLLVVELISGLMQVGDDDFEQRSPAEVNVAGDPGDQQGPTYATFGPLRSAPAADDGALLTQRVARDGTVTDDPVFASYGVTAVHRVTVYGIDHQVASTFWEFMNSSGLVYEDGEYVTAPLFLNPFYATGYPLAEAYWTTVEVGGAPRDVLVQCFERRCLTYTPDNPEGWRVEAGNVGRHYFIWRYGMEPGL
ncbi:MAG TPA: S8 family serine peptidase [Thermomicrobiales bacterium]|nr:S8 family serine peptidase [Thermomicrobiales bacterium]